jgi:hypothetical protein
MMKRLIIILVMAMIIAAPMFGQIPIADLQNSFSTFSDDVSQALPFAAAATGLTWSDAKVMGFPRFGVGISLSAVTLPIGAFEEVATSLGFALPSELGDIGVPLPGYAIDARMGIPFLPIDVGAKLGYMTPGMGDALESATGASAEYLIAGMEVRYPILKGNLLMPAVSIGAGYTYLNGSVAMSASGLDTSYNFGGILITANNPDIQFAWKTHALDFNAQVSKGLLFLTPYLGAGYSYGWSQAGGGVKAALTGNVQAVEDAYDIEIDQEEGFLIYSDSNGGSLRAYGGVSFNLFILKLDVNAQYNFMTQSIGGGLNARIQI